MYLNRKFNVLGFVSLVLVASCVNTISPSKDSVATSRAAAQPGEKIETLKSLPSQEQTLYALDFSKGAKIKADARQWLTDNGFEFESDAKYQSSLGVSFDNDALALEAKGRIFGMMIKKIRLDNAKKIRIAWGVTKFPKGASYDRGVHNEAIMVYVYFGDKKLPSNSWFIPDGPYFLGLYLEKTDRIGKPRIGRHFKEGGRFICLANPKEGETITSEFDLDKGFKECFKKEDVPFVSAIALEVETSDSGPSKAFIKKIEILG